MGDGLSEKHYINKTFRMKTCPLGEEGWEKVGKAFQSEETHLQSPCSGKKFSDAMSGKEGGVARETTGNVARSEMEEVADNQIMQSL